MHFIPLHCKLDRKRMLKYAILLQRLCDPVELIVLILLTCTRKINLSGYILEIENIFVLLNGSFIKQVKRKISILPAVYFSLTCLQYIVDIYRDTYRYISI